MRMLASVAPAPTAEQPTETTTARKPKHKDKPRKETSSPAKPAKPGKPAKPDVPPAPAPAVAQPDVPVEPAPPAQPDEHANGKGANGKDESGKPEQHGKHGDDPERGGHGKGHDKKS